MKTIRYRVVNATVGVGSNLDALVDNPAYFRDVVWECLLNDYHAFAPAADGEPLDGEFLIWDCDRPNLEIVVQGHLAVASGPVAALEQKAKDRRFAMLGTQGFLYRFILYILERNKQTYSFHSNALYDERSHTLIVSMGGAGAGKTPVLLSGIAKGWKVFSTELTHFTIEDGRCVFLKGGLYDNVRVGNLTQDFPEVSNRLALDLPRVADVWGTKICVDLRGAEAKPDRLVDPTLRILFPHVEAGWDTPVVKDVSDRTALQKALYDNASEKVGSSFLLYESVPVPGLDSPELARARFEAMGCLVDVARLDRAQNLLASPRACLTLF
jgi:hypothetical protein